MRAALGIACCLLLAAGPALGFYDGSSSVTSVASVQELKALLKNGPALLELYAPASARLGAWSFANSHVASSQRLRSSTLRWQHTRCDQRSHPAPAAS